MNAVKVAGLSRTFNSRRAVDDISFTVEVGEIFGFLGHNGVYAYAIEPIVSNNTNAIKTELTQKRHDSPLESATQISSGNFPQLDDFLPKWLIAG